ncbi:hypothetical protein VNO78_32795 [Psophocarpus tetragonolobus]|uniref:RING-type E3 ubiquitin transferase n=1 Tax=Psophocarpus tetragonolobus TaxID=3891 RepID=A0AAN9P000_PSOTE
MGCDIGLSLSGTLVLKHLTSSKMYKLLSLVSLIVITSKAQTSMEPVPTYISHHSWEPSVAITVGAIILGLIIMGLISIYIRRCSESPMIMRTTQSSSLPCSCSQGINKDVLNTFPTLFFSNIQHLNKGIPSLECAVCLSDFTLKDSLRLLPKCNHVFHPQCIDSWLASHVTCPVCRANLCLDSCQLSIPLQPDHQLSPTTQQLTPNTNHCVDADCCHSVSAVERKNLSRSNSTGHSLGEEEKGVERYTLRLPEDVRRYILVNHGRSVERSSSLKGLCWTDSQETNNTGKTWVICTPPFVAPHC